MADERIGIDQLIAAICEHLAETDAEYRAYVAATIGAVYDDDDRALEAISEVLSDPATDSAVVVSTANDCLTGRYALQSDGAVLRTVDGPAP